MDNFVLCRQLLLNGLNGEKTAIKTSFWTILPRVNTRSNGLADSMLYLRAKIFPHFRTSQRIASVFKEIDKENKDTFERIYTEFNYKSRGHQKHSRNFTKRQRQISNRKPVLEGKQESRNHFYRNEIFEILTDTQGMDLLQNERKITGKNNARK